jgi:hypothetical protein
MAHSTDYQSQMRDFHSYVNLTSTSKLKKSPSTMNPQSHIPPHNSPYPADSAHHHAYILTCNFLRNNSNWSIDSIFTYCLIQYKDFDITPAIISRAISAYIDHTYPTETHAGT